MSTTSLTVSAVPSPTGSYSEFYGYQSALLDAATGTGPQRNIVYLYESGCVTDSGSTDCDLVCNNSTAGAELVWAANGPMVTLHNCMLYPVLAIAKSKNLLVENPAGTLKKFNINQDKTVLGNVTNGQLAPASWPVINSCLVEASGLSEDVYDSHINPQQANYTLGSAGNIYRPGFNLPSLSCPAVHPNTDLAGPGVIISYLIQLLLLLCIWLWTDITFGWIKRIRRQRPVPTVERPPSFKRVASDASIDFQKAQIFFAITIQIASLIVLVHTKSLESPNWTSLFVNESLIVLLAMENVITIIFSVISLRKQRRLGWFITLFSISAVILAIATIIAIASSPPNIADLGKAENGFTACGGFTPSQSCFNPTFSDTYSELAVILIFPCLAFLCILLEKFRFWPSTRSLNSSNLNIFEKVYELLPRTLAQVCYIIMVILEILVELYILVVILFLLWALSVNIGDTLAYDEVWSLGQIIAVGLYAPVIICFAWEAGKLFKRERGTPEEKLHLEA